MENVDTITVILKHTNIQYTVKLKNMNIFFIQRNLPQDVTS